MLTLNCVVCVGIVSFTLCCWETVHVLNLNRDQLCFCMFHRPENGDISDFLDPSYRLLHRLPQTDCSQGTLYGSNESKS